MSTREVYEINGQIAALLDKSRQAALAAKAEKSGKLEARKTRDESGREITKFVGDPMAWMQYFMSPGQTVRIDKTAGRGR